MKFLLRERAGGSSSRTICVRVVERCVYPVELSAVQTRTNDRPFGHAIAARTLITASCAAGFFCVSVLNIAIMSRTRSRAT